MSKPAGFRGGFVPPGGGDTPPEDILRKVRVPLVRRVELIFPEGKREAYLIDVGLLGIFVEWVGPFPSGQTVGVRFHLPENERAVEGTAHVAWQNPSGERALAPRLPEGVGLVFDEISEDDRGRIRECVLAHWRGNLSARRFHPAWPDDALWNPRVE
jgi:Tfp pilus assembly protein PilZ